MGSERSLRNHFSGLALDRAELLRNDPAALAAAWPEARVQIVDFEGRTPGDGDGPKWSRGAALGAERREQASFLGQDGQGRAYFALPATALLASEQVPAGYWLDLRAAAAHWSRFDSGVFAYAKALLLWQSRARHCGACGAPTQLERAGHCARCRNSDCGLQHFPRTDAAIIVLVKDGDRALLGRQRSWRPRRWSTLAGFVEPGESLEDAVRREVGEESGVRLARVDYHSSQPWPFPGALMVGFHAVAAEATIQVGEELEDARWFGAEELLTAIRTGEVDLPPGISISRRLILDWLEQHHGSAAIADLHD